ncbi:uncharacterized protein A1O5_02184 [Cladophialophora psammophila CBS 110553]|uniref:DUF7703 domain-containing protein n=1 Tax=Cladophialophora psammophila CBS 110553 TaxID=1182543 RepID=W9X5K7_9EURO|nr:uncharacterized protein A1O5_02184 [Cladophialophora psammophila CBS 110553]EXJ75488.1 hypothetical protein A1O5_02184 [Cladophialophora psammophila CBS 110553]
MSAITEASQDFQDEWTAEAIIVVTCMTISLYNCVELLLTILTTFREWHGLYFVSLIVASVGIIPYCLGFILEYFEVLVFWAALMFSTIGWVMMITGQSFVLYSRLGLILQNDRILKGIKWMIITDALIFHTLTTVFQYGQAYGGEKSAFNRALFYMEKIQMTAFCIQEFIISGIYLWKTVQLLNLVSKEGTRRVMWELLTINAIIILMDIALLSLEYKGLRTMERAFKSFIYSVKLKMEFAVLGKLVNLVQSSTRALSNALADVDSFRTPSTATHSQQNDQMPDWMAKLESRPIHIEQVQPGQTIILD